MVCVGLLVASLLGCSAAPSGPLRKPVVTAAPTPPLLRGAPGQLVEDLASGKGVGIFDAETGRLLRSVVTARPSYLMTVSHGGRYAYMSDATPPSGAPCVARLNLDTGEERQLGICATDLAVSADGRMLAYTEVGGRHGLRTSLVIKDRRTGRHRRTLLAQNCKGCNNGIFGADLSWSPDDRHLAVAVYATAAIVSLQVLPAWRGSVATAPSVLGCRRVDPSCRRPVFDDSGALIFVRQGRRLGLSVVRLVHGILTRLYAFAPRRYGDDPLIDPRTDAFIWQDTDARGRDRRTHLWFGGVVRQLSAFHAALPDAVWR